MRFPAGGWVDDGQKSLKRVQAALAESEERYRALLDSVSDIVFVTDLSARMVLANRSLHDKTGFGVEDFQFPQAENPFIHPDDAPAVAQFIAQFVGASETRSEAVENRFIDRKGGVHRFRSVISKVGYEGKPGLQFVTRATEADLAAAQSFQKLRDSELVASAAVKVLDHLPFGVLLTGPEAEVIYLNEIAARILGEREGLVVRFGSLAAETQAETAELRRLIRGAIRPPPGLPQNPWQALRIDRPTGAHPLYLKIGPLDLGHSLPQGIPGRTAAAVFVSDPGFGPEPSSEALQRLFGLTPAEADVLKMLVRGLDTEAVAEIRGISLNTLRTQLKRLYEKTNTKRQHELVSLVMSSPAWIGRKPDPAGAD